MYGLHPPPHHPQPLSFTDYGGGGRVRIQPSHLDHVNLHTDIHIINKVHKSAFYRYIWKSRRGQTPIGVKA